MRNLGAISLKKKVMLVALTALAVMFFSVSMVFLRTMRSLQEFTVGDMSYMANELCDSVDKVLMDVQNTSDLFAENPTLIQCLDADYTGTDDVYKRMSIQWVRNTVFISYNRPEQTGISAIYNARSGQLFNFVDNRMDRETVERLLALDITAAEKLSMTCWYPLQDNFLSDTVTGEIRQDSVVVGSRRIYQHDKAGYPYVQVFSIPEKTFSDLYAGFAAQTGSRVYIVNASGGLISSSCADAVEARAPGADILALADMADSAKVRLDGREFFVFVRHSQLTNRHFAGNGWTTMLLVPVSYATQGVTGLYLAFGITFLLCVLLSAVMLIYLYSQFMAPISSLSGAMKRVNEGDFGAYLDIPATNSEASQMIQAYNHMLASINRSVEEKIAYEKRTRELDMQVLVSQIDPHFLYNTLETIVWKANKAGHPDIGKIAFSLGRLYRLSISGGDNRVTLGREIEHVARYVEIQRARYEGRFLYVPPRVDEATAALTIPKIILQPIVENAFLYAVPDSQRPVTIRVKVRVRQGCVVVTVTDNGCGMDKQRLAAVRRRIHTGEPESPGDAGCRRSSGIGLHNISARLELYMGAKQALRISSKKGFGTRIAMVLPAQPQDQ